MNHSKKKTKFDLSVGQKALWLLERLNPSEGVYNGFYIFRVLDKIDESALKESLQHLVNRHPALRTVYEMGPAAVQQRVLEHIEVDFKSISQDGNNLEELIYRETKRPFDLQKSSHTRWRLIKSIKGEYFFTVVLHHGCSDLWSICTIMNELSLLYPAYKNQHPLSLLPVTRTYSDFVLWQKEYLESEEAQRDLTYWENYLKHEDDICTLELPTDYTRKKTLSSKADICVFYPNPKILDALKQFSLNNNISPFALYLSIFHLFLFKLTNQRPILVGTPTAGRGNDFAGIYGYFVSPIVTKTCIDGKNSFLEYVTAFQSEIVQSLKHQNYPFPLLTEKLKVKRDSSRSPVFQSTFTWDNANRFENRDNPLIRLDKNGKEIWGVSEFTLERQPFKQQWDFFDLNLKMVKHQSNMYGIFEYSTDLFKKSTIERFCDYFTNLLESIAKKPDSLIMDLSLLPLNEISKITSQWNSTESHYEKEYFLHNHVNSIAQSSPQSIALVYEGEEFSYSYINDKSNQLAHFLIEQGLDTQSIVGISTDRSQWMIIGLLSILKAGCAYLPLDPEYPEERLSYMIRDSNISYIVSQSNVIEGLPSSGYQHVCLDKDWDKISSFSKHLPEITITPSSLAYVIYTSGSTGNPKGVLVEHAQLCHFMATLRDKFDIQQNDRVLQFATLNFDASVFTYCLALQQGACLFLAEKEALLGEALIEFIESNSLTAVMVPPSVLARLEAKKYSSLKYLMVAGEPVSKELASRWASKGHKLINVYGPTETTVWATTAVLDGEIHPPIGKALANTRVYILDQYLKVVPVGVTGEIFIGGGGVTRGYLNNPDLNKEKFIIDPYNPSPNSRMYRTGDLGKFLSDGSIECLGRVDHQIKLRGFRVELGEIEASLNQHPQIIDSLVITKLYTTLNVDETQLVAYVVKNPRGYISSNELREYLKHKLPDYMVPTSIVILDAFPLTPNEKIDRDALPEPNTGGNRSKAFAPPRNETERLISQAWQKCLGMKEVSVTENFFDLGGHSLLMAQVHNLLPEALKDKANMVDLFKHPTIQSLAHFIEEDIEEEDFFLERDNHVERLRLRRRLMEQLGGSSIAIVGMSGRFPGADTVDKYWQNICDKSESITFFDPEELENAGVPEEVYKKDNYVAAKAVLDNISGFEAPFFNFTPREAQITDPQQRLFLECAWESLEDAGCVPSEFDGRIGVYGGIGMNQYLMTHLSTHPELLASVGDYPVMLGNDKDFLCTRVSYKLNLDGPAMVLQTACSTSLVAVHTACQALIHQECDVALAGGVSLGRLEEAGYLHQEGMIMSRDGHCRAFDAKASGTVQGQGCGIVVLKRLIDAMDNYDHIYAVISGSAINNDGSNKSGYTAPSIEGQAKAINMAQVAANVSPNQISYVEAHGTGTTIGDPIEIEALKQAFQQDTRPDAKKNATAPPQAGSCAIGSVKTNIGHLDAASGIAGLIKTAKALEAKKLPPTINYKTPNPKIDFASTPFYVNTELKEWDTDGQPRFAAVSSFGMGGTNAHAILTDAPNQTKQEPARPWHIVLLSARTPTALEAMTNRFVEHLKDHVEQSFSDVCYTLHVGRTVFPYRRYLVCRNRDEAIAELEPVNQRKVRTSRYINRSHKTVFMFSGQGSQYQNMGRYLYQVELAFRDEIDKCRSMLKQKFVHIFEELSDADYHGFSEKIHQTYITQPGLFMFEYAIAKMLMSWGIEPDYMVGHSIGEYVAACLAGVFTLEQALELVTIRGHLIQGLEGGDMLSVNLPESEAARFVNHDVSVAAVNGESRCVMSGASKAIQYLHETLDKQGIENRILHTSHAFHSHMMDPILERFKGYVQRRQPQAPKMPFVSSMTGEFITAEEATSPEYWTQHLRNTVQYHKAISTIFSTRQTPESTSTNSKEQSAMDEALIFLEVGPGKVLTTLTKQHPDKQPQDWILPTTRHAYEEISDTEHLMKIIARLWEQGVKINWNVFHQNRQRYRVPLPTYPFERQQHWIKPKTQHYQPEDLRILEDNVHTPQDSAETADISDKVSARDEVENVIWKTWCQALGRMDIGVFDDFFELGGDSLLAVNIIDKLHRQFHVPMATHILIQKPTIADLAEHIKNYSDSKIGISEETETEPNTGALVVIQKGDPGVSPLIMVHPIGGEVFFYRDLARYLGRSQPVYAFQAPSLSGNAPTIHSVEVMAKLYTSELHKANLEPPYYLGGSSFGGLVAYEMAQQLTKLDAEVKLVVMVDTPSPTEMPRTLNNSAAILEYLLEDKLTLSSEKLHELDAKSQISYVLEQARLQGKASVLPPHLGESLFTTWMAHQEATFNYEPQAYMGNVLFFRHTEPMKHFPALPHLAWQSLVTGDFKVHQIPGNHVTMNYQPHVKTLADHLRPFLNY